MAKHSSQKRQRTNPVDEDLTQYVPNIANTYRLEQEDRDALHVYAQVCILSFATPLTVTDIHEALWSHGLSLRIARQQLKPVEVKASSYEISAALRRSVGSPVIRTRSSFNREICVPTQMR